MIKSDCELGIIRGGIKKIKIKQGRPILVTDTKLVRLPTFTKYVDPYSPRQEKEDSHGNVKFWQWDLTR